MTETATTEPRGGERFATLAGALGNARYRPRKFFHIRLVPREVHAHHVEPHALRARAPFPLQCVPSEERCNPAAGARLERPPLATALTCTIVCVGELRTSPLGMRAGHLTLEPDDERRPETHFR